MDIYPYLYLLFSIFFYGFFGLVRTSLIRGRLSFLNEQAGFGVKKAEYILENSKHYIIIAHIGTYISACFSGLLLFIVSFDESYPLVILKFLVIIILALLSNYILRGFAYKNPNGVLRVVAIPYLFVSKLLYPLYLVINVFLKLLANLGLNIPNERELPISAEEITELVERSSAAGEINQSEKEMIKGVFDFSDTRVKEIMTPRIDIIFLDTESSIEEAKSLFLTTMHSRILVVDSELDNVKGVLFAKDFLKYIGSDIENLTIKDLIRPVTQVFAGSRVDRILREFKRNATHFAVVSDEHGGIAGIITIEDLLEELVGDIYDEYDGADDRTEVRETSSDELYVDGGVLIDDLNNDYGLNLPVGDYDTLAGYIIWGLGYLPEIKDMYLTEEYSIEVIEKEKNRITKLKIKKL